MKEYSKAKSLPTVISLRPSKNSERRLSVSTYHVRNYWTDFDEKWYGRQQYFGQDQTIRIVTSDEDRVQPYQISEKCFTVQKKGHLAECCGDRNTLTNLELESSISRNQKQLPLPAQEEYELISVYIPN
jgi:hypothetical protein